MVAARDRFLGRGHYRPLAASVRSLAARYDHGGHGLVVDLPGTAIPATFLLRRGNRLQRLLRPCIDVSAAAAALRRAADGVAFAWRRQLSAGCLAASCRSPRQSEPALVSCTSSTAAERCRDRPQGPVRIRRPCRFGWCRRSRGQPGRAVAACLTAFTQAVTCWWLARLRGCEPWPGPRGHVPASTHRNAMKRAHNPQVLGSSLGDSADLLSEHRHIVIDCDARA